MDSKTWNSARSKNLTYYSFTLSDWIDSSEFNVKLTFNFHIQISSNSDSPFTIKCSSNLEIILADCGTIRTPF